MGSVSDCKSAPAWLAVSPMIIGGIAVVLAVAVSVAVAVVWMGVTLALLLAVARRLVSSGAFGFFITQGPHGPRSRLVTHLAVEDDLAIWFVTHAISSKVAELTAHDRCAYSIEDRSSMAYVTLAGVAHLV